MTEKESMFNIIARGLKVSEVFVLMVDLMIIAVGAFLYIYNPILLLMIVSAGFYLILVMLPVFTLLGLVDL